MTITQFIKLTLLTLSLGLFSLLITGSTQAEITQNDFSCTTVNEIPQLECESLVALYENTDGPNWSDNTGWLVSGTPCSWHGVSCEEGHVTLLSFGGFSGSVGLKGAIPPEIGNLSALKSLSLSGNQISSLPSEIGNLFHMTELTLDNNQLSTLPERIGNLSRLTKLTLDNNQLRTLPKRMVNLSRLITFGVFGLTLHANHLTDITDEALLAWMDTNAPNWAASQTPAESTPLTDTPTPTVTPTIAATPTPVPLAFTPTDAYLELVSQTGGEFEALRVHDGYAYVGVGSKLMIWRLENAIAPTLVGETSPLPGIVQDIAISGDYAYLAASEGGLRVIDISTPSSPQEVAFLEPNRNEWFKNIEIQGDYAYITGDGLIADGFYVIDISNPTVPVEISFLDIEDSPEALFINGNYAYIYGGRFETNLVRIIDISTPSDPQEINLIETLSTVRSATANGDYLYVLSDSLQILDVSSPMNPQEAGFYAIDAWGDIAFHNDLLYIMAGSLHVIAVSDPTIPQEVADLEMAGGTKLAIGDNHLYVPYEDSVQIVDISTPNTPQVVGTSVIIQDIYGLIRDVVVKEDLAFMASDSGFHIAEIASPSNPQEIGFVAAQIAANTVAVRGNYAYVGTYSGLLVIDTASPSTPKIVANIALSGASFGEPTIEDIVLQGNYAYVATDHYAEFADLGLRIVDISDPTAPYEVGVFNTAGNATQLAVRGDYAYVADGENGLQIIDISTPINPLDASLIETGDEIKGVALHGDYAYLMEREVSYDEDIFSGVRVIDISTPTEPQEITRVETSLPGIMVSLGNLGILADGTSVRLMDISAAMNPQEVRSYETAGYVYSVAAHGDLIMVADGWGGLLIFRLTDTPPATRPAATPTPVSTATPASTSAPNVTATPIVTVTPVPTLPVASVADGPSGCEKPTIVSAKSGHWRNRTTWNPEREPTADDIVWIQADHTITGVTLSVRALCNEGVLESAQNVRLRITASDFVINYPESEIVGLAGETRTGGLCGYPGSSVLIQPPRGGDGVAITNHGRIVAGKGGDANRCGGRGGSIYLMGRNVRNESNALICANNGGRAFGIHAGYKGGEGGNTSIRGNYGGPGELINRGVICAGDGGDANQGATESQAGGNGGWLSLIAQGVDLSDGTQRSGEGGKGVAGGENGEGSTVRIDPPATIKLGGATIEGGDIVIFGGDEWVLDFSTGGSMTVISATNNITFAVGTGGSIDLRDSENLVIQANESVLFASDDIQLAAGDELADFVSAPSVATEDARLLYDVSIIAPNLIVASGEETIEIELTILNNGPAEDAYTLRATAPDGWRLNGLPTEGMTVDGLSSQELTLSAVPTMDTDLASNNGVIELHISSQSSNAVHIADIEIVAGQIYEVHLPVIMR